MPILPIQNISKLNPVWQDEIYKAANRPLNTGFFYDAPGHEDHIFEPEDKVVGFDFVGLVMGYDAETRYGAHPAKKSFQTWSRN